MVSGDCTIGVEQAVRLMRARPMNDRKMVFIAKYVESEV